MNQCEKKAEIHGKTKDQTSGEANGKVQSKPAEAGVKRPRVDSAGRIA